MFTTRRECLTAVGATVAGLFGATGSGSAASETTLEGQFCSHDGTPVPRARIGVSYYDTSEDEGYFDYVRTDDDGRFWTTVPAGQRIRLGFYKSSADAFLAPRRDGIPHIHALSPVTVTESGYDLGEYQLPQAYTLDARAVFAGRPGGVEGAVPRFGSVRDGSYYASGYSYLTTDDLGYVRTSRSRGTRR